MPEGPEVEAARCLVERGCMKLIIRRVVAAEDAKVFCGRTPEELKAALEGRRVMGAKRKGKYMWVELDGEGPLPLIHLGMAGSVIVEGLGAAKYKRVEVDTEHWPPRFTKLELHLEGDSDDVPPARLAFTDSRRFGKVQLLTDPSVEEPVSKLGFDVITDMPDAPEFARRLGAYQRPGSTLRIKALLLDQTFTAGVGNWIADEVLYQARIHPEQPVADMTEFQMNALHSSMNAVLKLAVSVEADSDQFPRDWLFHYRWTGKRASQTAEGHRIDFVTVGSRTSAYVPALQKVIAGTGLSKKAAPRKVPVKKNKPKKDEADAPGAAEEQYVTSDADVDMAAADSTVDADAGAAVAAAPASAKPVRAAKKRAPRKRSAAAAVTNTDEQDSVTPPASSAEDTALEPVAPAKPQRATRRARKAAEASG